MRSAAEEGSQIVATLMIVLVTYAVSTSNASLPGRDSAAVLGRSALAPQTAANPRFPAMQASGWTTKALPSTPAFAQGADEFDVLTITFFMAARCSPLRLRRPSARTGATSRVISRNLTAIDGLACASGTLLRVATVRQARAPSTDRSDPVVYNPDHPGAVRLGTRERRRRSCVLPLISALEQPCSQPPAPTRESSIQRHPTGRRRLHPGSGHRQSEHSPPARLEPSVVVFLEGTRSICLLFVIQWARLGTRLDSYQTPPIFRVRTAFSRRFDTQLLPNTAPPTRSTDVPGAKMSYSSARHPSADADFMSTGTSESNRRLGDHAVPRTAVGTDAGAPSNQERCRGKSLVLLPTFASSRMRAAPTTPSMVGRAPQSPS